MTRDDVVEQFRTFDAATGRTLRLELEEVFADDTHAISLVRLQASRPDKPGRHMDVKEANVFHLDYAGHAYEIWGISEDQDAIDAFWS